MQTRLIGVALAALLLSATHETRAFGFSFCFGPFRFSSDSGPAWRYQRPWGYPPPTAYRPYAAMPYRYPRYAPRYPVNPVLDPLPPLATPR